MEAKNKTTNNIEKQTGKTQPTSGGNKALFWILGGCLVIILIGALIFAGFVWWGYKKVKKEIKMKDAAMVLQQKQMEATKTEAQKARENAPANIPEEPTAQPPVSNQGAPTDGTTPTVTEKQIGYIKNVSTKNGKNYLSIDYIQWLTGPEAEKAMREDGQCPKTGECIVFDDYYIRNQNPLVRTFEISPDVKIVMQTYDAEQTGVVLNNQEITFEQFRNIFVSKDRLGLRNVPYIVELNSNKISKITEQYIP